MLTESVTLPAYHAASIDLPYSNMSKQTNSLLLVKIHASADCLLADQDEDVDIGTNDGPYEQPLPAEEMEIDEKPQVSALFSPDALLTTIQTPGIMSAYSMPYQC